jgi:hypothetical protein
MSAPVVEEWPWRRVIFVNHLPSLNVWPKRLGAAGDRAFAREMIPVAFFLHLIGRESLPCWLLWISHFEPPLQAVVD